MDSSPRFAGLRMTFKDGGKYSQDNCVSPDDSILKHGRDQKNKTVSFRIPLCGMSNLPWETINASVTVLRTRFLRSFVRPRFATNSLGRNDVGGLATDSRINGLPDELIREPFLSLFYLRPGIAQRNGAVENEAAFRRFVIHAVIAEPLELEPVLRFRLRQSRLELAAFHDFERIGIE